MATTACSPSNCSCKATKGRACWEAIYGSGDGDCEDQQEPLGYQHFLCDVNIEYSSGGNRTSAASNKHSFKLKYLPYMVRRDSDTQKQWRKNSISSSNSSICDNQASSTTTTTTQDDDYSLNSRHIDVSKATCAFLGNSDYVPNNRRRRVVLELISAKLSQSTTFNIPASSSSSSLVTLPEQSLPSSTNTSHHNESGTSIRFGNNTSINSGTSNSQTHSNLATSPSPSSLSSKRFVNYILLIKTAPGLDNHPAVIERRFSDFLLLYQGLKSREFYAKIVDKHVTFPKKVYMGNFSLTNIAERSIEFCRLLNLCMTNVNLLWSTPFVSFLLDKELKEAHRLSLCGDPDDVQALIETVYYIQSKLYLGGLQASTSSESSISLDHSSFGTTTDRYGSPLLPNGKHHVMNSPTNETISTESNYSNHLNRPSSTDPSSSPNHSMYDTSEEFSSLSLSKGSLTPLNQRILVTFCMLFLTYYRGENYHELRFAVQKFNQLISSQEYVDSLINTRHYMTLRACLLFLMNMNHGNVIDENQRVWLKRKLEDIDGAHADLNESFTSTSTQSTTLTTDNDSYLNSPRDRKRNEDSINNNTSAYRVIRGDLTSLLRDRNFCSFQDGKYSR